jgi:flagellar hook-length control protein FliK
MNNVILDLMPKNGGTPIDGAASGLGTKAGSAFDAELFRTTLAGQVRRADGAAAPRQSVVQALQTKISKMLEAGASQADVIAALSEQLASSVAQTLRTPGADARAQLQTLFATALAPPGRGDPASLTVADRALHLAQRFTRLANLADAIAGQPSGQQKRIAGHVLDAQRAKDIPARLTTSDAAQAAGILIPAALTPAASTPAAFTPDALTPVALGTPAVAAAPFPVKPVHFSLQTVHELMRTPASPVLPTAAAAPSSTVAAATAAAAQSGDGRRVNIGSRASVATGGDTGLGRILTRAVLAADGRAAVAALLPDAPSTPDTAKTAGEPGATILTLPAAPTQAATPAAATHQAGATGAPAAAAAPSAAALSAFARSFEAALSAGRAADAPRSAQHDLQPASAATTADVDTAASAIGAPPILERPAGAMASAPVPVPIPIDHSAIADQVLRGAFLRNVGTTSEIRLTLVPDTLGDVSVKLVVASGTVAAHVVAETSEVRDALIAAQPALTKSLADAGLKLTSFNVDLAGSGFAGFSQHQNASRQHNGRAREGTASSDTGDGGDEAPLAAIPSFGPSVAGKPAAGDYNYLV